MLIIVATAGKIDGLEELLDEFDRAGDADEQEGVASKVYELIGLQVGGMMQRAAAGRTLGKDEVAGLAWQAIFRGLTESGMPRLKRTDGDWDTFVARIRNLEAPPAKKIWSLLPDKLRRSLASPYLKATITDELIRELNGLLRRRDLYDPNAFAGVVLSDEGRHLLSKEGRLSARELARFNSMLLSSAFPEINSPEQPKRNLLGYLSSTVIPQMKPQIWEAASGLPVDKYAIEAWNDLKPFVQQLDQMQSSGALPEGFERMSRAEQVYQLQKQQLSQRYGPIVQWWNDRIRDLQPDNPFEVKDRGSLRDAKQLLAQHADITPEKLWGSPGSAYYLPAIAVAPYGMKSIERMLGAGRPRSQIPESQAAPQAPGTQQSQSFFMAAQPGAYQMMANRVYDDPGYDVERAVAAFLSSTPQPTQQQIEQFIAQQPLQVAETIREVGFPAIVQEVDQKILDHARDPQTQAWLTNAMGRQPQEVQATLLAICGEVSVRIARMAKSDSALGRRQARRDIRTCGLTIICTAANRT